MHYGYQTDEVRKVDMMNVFAEKIVEDGVQHATFFAVFAGDGKLVEVVCRLSSW